MKSPLPTITVEKDITEVFDFLAIPRHEPQWAQTYGVRRTVENQMVAFSATDEKGTPVRGRFTLESAGGQTTRVVVDCEAEPSGFKKLFKPMMESHLRRDAEADLNLLLTELSQN